MDYLPNLSRVGYTDSTTTGLQDTSFSDTGIMIHGFEFFDPDSSGNFKGMRFTSDNDIRPQWTFVYPKPASPLITEFDLSAKSAFHAVDFERF